MRSKLQKEISETTRKRMCTTSGRLSLVVAMHELHCTTCCAQVFSWHAGHEDRSLMKAVLAQTPPASPQRQRILQGGGATGSAVVAREKDILHARDARENPTCEQQDAR